MRWGRCPGMRPILGFVAAAAAACAAPPAQTLRAANYTARPFAGWVRCTVPAPALAPGECVGPDDFRVVPGRAVGGVRVVDVRVWLPPGAVRTVPLADLPPGEGGKSPVAPPTVATLPAVGGASFRLREAGPDGAAWSQRWRARLGMLACELWVRHYPDWPGVAIGEVVYTASNPTLPDMCVTVPDCTIKWEGAIAYTPTMPSVGDVMADGQARASRVVVVWPRAVRDWAAVVALLAPAGVCAMGLDAPWPTGCPVSAPSPLAWTTEWLPRAEASLRGWSPCGLGPSIDSRVTGAQEDQLFVGGELGAAAGLGAEVVRYLVALGQFRQPCHHLEADGGQLVLADHPRLVMWDSRAHYSAAVSPDQLGKPRPLQAAEAHGWWGPDEQHWLLNTLCVAARATGSPALQWQLEAKARNLIVHYDSRAGELRAAGWRALAYWWLSHVLEDRVLAERVVADARAFAAVVRRDWEGRPWWWVDTDRAQDTQGTGRDRVSLVWQHGLATYALDLLGEQLGDRELRALARRGAIAALAAWAWDGERWAGWGYVGTSGGVFGPLVEGDGAHWGSGVESWMTLTIATVLRHEPQHERALAIQAQLLRERAQQGRWLPPEWLR